MNDIEDKKRVDQHLISDNNNKNKGNYGDNYRYNDIVKKKLQPIISNYGQVAITFLTIFISEFISGLFINTNIDLIKIEFGSSYMIAYCLISSFKGFLSFFASIIFGTLSDRVGRKPLIMLLMFLVYLPNFLILKRSYLAYFILHTLASIFNTHINLLMTYGADISSNEDRNQIFSILASAGFFANALASILGEFLIIKRNEIDDFHSLDFTYVVTVSFFILIANLTFIYFTLQNRKPGIKYAINSNNSNKNDNYADNNNGNNNNNNNDDDDDSKKHYKGVIKTLKAILDDNQILYVLKATTVSIFVLEGLISTNFLYLRYIIEFSENQLAIYILLSLLVFGISSLILPQVLVNCFGNKKAILFALFAQFVAANVSGIFGLKLIIFFNIPIIAIGLMLIIIALGFTSQRVPQDQQGIFIGFFSGIKHLIYLISPPFTAFLFNLFQQNSLIGGNHIKILDSYIDDMPSIHEKFVVYLNHGTIGPLFTGIPYIFQSFLLLISFYYANQLDNDDDDDCDDNNEK